MSTRGSSAVDPNDSAIGTTSVMATRVVNLLPADLDAWSTAGWLKLEGALDVRVVREARRARLGPSGLGAGESRRPGTGCFDSNIRPILHQLLPGRHFSGRGRVLALGARSEPRNVEAGDAQVSAFVPFDPMSTSSGAVTVRSGSLDGDLPVWWPVSLHPGDLLLVAGRVPWRRLANYTGRPRSLELIRWRAVRAESTVLSAVPIDMELRGLT